MFAFALSTPDHLYAVVVRSPQGHAVVEGIEAAAARALPGVRGVFTGERKGSRPVAMHRPGGDGRADHCVD